MARLAHYLMASEWRAALIASLLLFLPLVSWAGASVVALYELRRGPEKSPLVIGAPFLVASLMELSFDNSAILLVLGLTVALSAVLHRALSWLAVLMVGLGLSLI